MLLTILVALLTLSNCSGMIRQTQSPSNIARNKTIWQSCPCGSGLKQLTLWTNDKDKFTLQSRNMTWIKLKEATKKISWKCDGSQKSYQTSIDLQTDQWLSIQFFNKTKTGSFPKCDKQTGKICFNTWTSTQYLSSIPFTSHTEGYACFKIPTLLKTQKGTLIVFAEARTPGCDDFDRTDLVYKRSYDNGRTWSKVTKLINQTEKDQGQCGHALVIGNISPVQLRNDSKTYPGRIIAPYTRNNFKLWIVYSDDDGLTWHGNHQIPGVSQTQEHPDCNRNMSYFGYKVDQFKLKNTPDFIRFFLLLCRANNPYNNLLWTRKLKGPWQFIGVGPSRGLQLKSGRVLIPGYKSPMRGLSQVPGALPISQLYNNFAKGFVLISDDDGDTWRQGNQWPIGQGANEHQLVQLDDGTVLSNSRSLSTGSPQFRLQTVSFTQGDIFSVSQFTSIPEPFAGCQGSTVGGRRGKIFVASPNPNRGKSLLQYMTDALGCNLNLNGRERLSLWISHDNGKSYKQNQVIDEGLSAQTSLQYQNGKLYLLYEQADPLPKTIGNKILEESLKNLRVLIPTRFVYRQLPINDNQMQ